MQVKMPKNVNDPEEGFLNMGAELRTNKLNVLVKPANMAADKFEWWRHPLIDLVDDQGVKHGIKYRIGGPRAKPICSSYAGCKRLRSECKDKCDESALTRKMLAQSFSQGSSSRAPGPRAEGKRKRDATAMEALEALLAHSSKRKLDPNNPSDVPKHQRRLAGTLGWGSARLGANAE